MWLNDFKKAVILKDPQAIKKLIDEMPKFQNIDDMKEASYLIKEAYIFMNQKKDETLKTLQNIKKNINFIKSNMKANKHSLDITS